MQQRVLLALKCAQGLLMIPHWSLAKLLKPHLSSGELSVRMFWQTAVSKEKTACGPAL